MFPARHFPAVGSSRMRQFPFLTCLLLASCLGFGFPSISETPTVAVPTNEVRAFRVVSEDWMSGPWMTGPITILDSVEEIPVKNCVVAPQHNAYFAYYYLVFPVLNGSHSRTIKVLLYRPGYELVEIPARPWWNAYGSDVPEKIVWKEAPDLQTQKAAVDRIALSLRGKTANKDVLRFAAREYGRLAECPAAALPGSKTLRNELQGLAHEYEQRAREIP
jgi:hypothetical protein